MTSKTGSSMPILQRLDRLDRLVTMFFVYVLFYISCSVLKHCLQSIYVYVHYVDDAAAVSGREALLVIQAFF